MIVKILNHSQQRIVSKIFIQSWVKKVSRELQKRKIKSQFSKMDVHIIFVVEKEIQKLNKNFRGRNKITDILSFSSLSSVSFPFEKNLLGELVLCPRFIAQKSKKRGVSVREETAYLLLHGFLHLLGYDHEKSSKEAQKMYRLQDQIFDQIYVH